MHSSLTPEPLRNGCLTRFANGCALLVISIGLLGILGWLLDIELLKRLAPGYQSMKFNTAFGLALAGISLRWRNERYIRLALGGLIALLGLLHLGEYAFSMDWGIDQLVLPDRDPSSEFSGRMSVMASICFLLSGLSLVLLNTPGVFYRSASELLAVSVAVIAGFALLGYLSSVKQLYQVPGFSSLALHTSIAFLVLSLGMLSIIPHSVAEMFVLSHQRHRKIWGSFCILLSILFGIGMMSIINSSSFPGAGATEVDKLHALNFHRILPLALLITTMILVVELCTKIIRIVLINETAIQHEKAALQTKTEELTVSQFKLQTQHEELDWLYQNTPVGLCLLDTEMRYLRINKRLAELNGLPVEAHIGRTLGEIAPTLEAKAKEITEQIKRTGQPVLNHEFSGEIAAAPGDFRYWNESWYPVFDASDKLTGFGAVVEEITEQKTAETALKESTERLRLAQKSASVGIWDWNLQTGQLLWTPELEAIYGLMPGQVSRQEDFRQRVHPDDLKKIDDLYDEVISSRQPFELEFRIIRPSGEIRWVNCRGRAHYDENDKPLRIIGSNIDITEHKQAEQALNRSREYARKQAEEAQAILDAAPVAIWIAHDPECRIITGNIYGNEIILGTPSQQNVSKSAPPGTISTMYHVYRRGIEVIANDLPAQRACISGKPVSPEELQLIFEDGRTVTMLIGATPLFDAQGSVRGAVAAGLDISERKALEYQIKDFNQRKDQFLATLSRELHNPLLVISSSVKLLMEKNLAEINRDFVCDILNKNVDQLNRLADDLMDVAMFSNGSLTLQKQQVDLINTLQQCVQRVLPLLNMRKRELAHDIPEVPIFIEGDPVRLAQIFNNLLDNAVKYTSAGGKIGLKILLEKNWVIVRIQDNGVGIAPHFLPYIFEFFTQFNLFNGLEKKSLGIGLFLAKQLVELHNGKITAFSAGQNQGAVFDIWLPKLNKEPAKSKALA